MPEVRAGEALGGVGGGAEGGGDGTYPAWTSEGYLHQTPRGGEREEGQLCA